MRDIDRIIHALLERHPLLRVEQLKVTHPVDDDGLWLFGHPGSSFEVQLESSTGHCPFLFETDEDVHPVEARSCEEAMRLVERGLGLSAQVIDPHRQAESVLRGPRLTHRPRPRQSGPHRARR